MVGRGWIGVFVKAVVYHDRYSNYTTTRGVCQAFGSEGDDFLARKPKEKLESWLAPDRLVLIRNWAMWGATRTDIARAIGISPKTLEKWVEADPRMANAVAQSGKVADAVIENSLFEKAASGDSKAMEFWLRNRRPEQWNSSKESAEFRESQRLDNEMKRIKIRSMEREVTEAERVKYRGIPADFMAAPFIEMHHDIQKGGHLEYVLPGGRGSAKSSTVSLEIVDLIEKNPEMHAVICREVADTMRNSVYNQVAWAIDMLGLTEDYKATTAPLEFTKKSTGQKIFFRGADDPSKLKSIAVPFGHIGVLWLEEFDQFKGVESVRKIEQSVIRGSDKAFVFKSFNPPRSKNNFANEYVALPKANRMVIWSNYTQVPPKWLGRHFLEEADWLRETNPAAYENEYMGVANGSGGNVFENVNPRHVSDEEISHFDRISQGVDWGWYPDPWAFVRVQYNPAQRQLIIFDEAVRTKCENEETARIIREEHGLTRDELIICDANEPKSISDYDTKYGLRARSAIKGPGSREYSFKWLAGLREIVIDPIRCPNAAREFMEYEFERDEEGEIVDGYPDGNDHTIDAVRYATEIFAKRQATIKVG